MTQHDKARELVEGLKVVARCGTDSTMRHSAYAFMAQDQDGDYVTYSSYAALAEENRRLREALRPFASAWEIAQASGLTDTSRLGALARNETASVYFMWASAALSSTGEK